MLCKMINRMTLEHDKIPNIFKKQLEKLVLT